MKEWPPQWREHAAPTSQISTAVHHPYATGTCTIPVKGHKEWRSYNKTIPETYEKGGCASAQPVAEEL